MNKQSFDLGWEYSEATEMMAGWSAQWQPVDLPHDAMISKPRSASNPSGGAGAYFPGGVANYRKKLHVPEEWRGRSVQLEFEGVYMNAEVSVNNQLLRLQPYGYTSFVVDIAPYLNYGQENDVLVTANNTAQPNSRWYTGTGIYRHVWLRTGGSLHIQPWGVFVTTPVVDPTASVVHVSTELASPSGPVDGAVLRTTVLDPAGSPMAWVETPLRTLCVQQTLLLKKARLWSVEEPNLYTLLSEVLVNGGVADTERTPFGIRSIAIDPQNGFRLNGIPMKLKGGCIHHDHGLLGAASYDRAEERKVELLRSAGFNALRSAHNPPAPALLDACDRLGMLVINETFDCWRIGKSPNDYHVYFEDWWQRDTAALVKRDRNHPSVIMWSIGNEILEGLGAIDGATWCKRQADYVRSLDNTRFVTSAIPFNFLEMQATGDFSLMFKTPPVPEDPQEDSWGILTSDFSQPLDVVGYNYMPQRYEVDRTRFPNRVIAGTETWPHMAYTFWKETERLPHVIGDFVWTALDYLGEAGIGAVNLEGQLGFGAPYPYHLASCGDFDICGFKRPQSYYRDLLWRVRTAPFIAVLDPQHFGKLVAFSPWGWEPVIDNWTFPGEEGKPTQVDIYAVDDEVEVLINGVSLGRKPAGPAYHNKVTFDVTYEPGVIEAVGYTAGRETGRTRLVTAARPASLRLTADRTMLNAAYGDIAFVTVEVVDADGVLVQHGEPAISLEVTGAAQLIAVGAANPLSEELYVNSERKAYHGRLLAVVRTTGNAGEITIEAQSEGLPTAQIQIRAG
ncbi:MAG: glycoside hydrolase family 2 protein [Chloroflexi bacterium]|nr:glycoside hydrolase family 2 protein [Chloroflexota bacterium]